MNVKIQTTEYLERRVVEVAKEIAQIRLHINEAKAKVILDGEYSDPHWYAKANYALRMKGIEHQSILTELAKRRRENRVNSREMWTEQFVTIAKRKLDPVVFRDILVEAQSE
jgi:predicted kinase